MLSPSLFQSELIPVALGKYIVVFFYPKDFTFVCPTEIIAFSDRIEEFKARNTEVVGISTDTEHCHWAWLDQPRKQGGLGGINYPLVADPSHSISKNYGVLIEEEGIDLRGLFLVDTEFKVRQITINDLPVGRSVDETLRLIDAFQFTDKHGEVCPANWKPGSSTIKTDPVKKLDYFSSAN